MQTKEPKSTWPAAARDLAKSLLRTERLAKLKDGIEIVRSSDTFDVRWKELRARSKSLELIAAKTWLIRYEGDAEQTIVAWCDAKEIGIYSKAFQLGRIRASKLRDLQPPLELSDYSLSSLDQAYADYTPTLEPQGKERTLLLLKHPSYPRYETRILIDTARHVILSIEQRTKDKATSITRFDDFVERGDSWWAQRIETTDEKGRRTSLITQTVKSLPLNDFDQQVKTELAGRAQVQFLQLPMPSVLDAKKALAAGKAGFEHHFVLMLHFLQSEQWTRVFEHLAQAEKFAADKPGMRWLRSALLYSGRRHEELRKRYQEDAARIAKGDAADRYFLAEYIVNQSASVFQTNEMLALLDTLRPLYDQQPPRVQAGKHWQQMRVGYLDQAGRSDEALNLRKQLAADYPRDYSLQHAYAQALAGTGDYPAAYAWLTRVLVKESKWLGHEEDSLRNLFAQFLQEQGRYDDLAKYLTQWVEQNPAGSSAYNQYVVALFKTDQIDKAEGLMLKWLKDAQVPGELKDPAEARMIAAVFMMLGQNNSMYIDHSEKRWLSALAEAVEFFAQHETNADIANQIMQDWRFQRTEQGAKLRKKYAGILTAEIDKLPVEQIQRFMNFVYVGDVDKAGWDKVIRVLRERWTNEAKEDVKHRLGQMLVSVLSHGDRSDDELLTFLRLRWQKAPERRRAEYANQLFERLLESPWSAEIEGEALSMLDKLTAAEDPGVRLYTSVAALHRLTDTFLESRIFAQTKKLEHPEKLTRTELFKKNEEIRRKAAEGLADRLRSETARQAKALAPWLLAESLYLDLPLDRKLKQIAGDIWEFLGAAPPVVVRGQEIIGDVAVQRLLEDVLRQRYLVMAANLAARKGAEPALGERLLKYLDKGIETDPEDGRWKLSKSRLLIALDRSKELEQTLRQWTRDAEADSRWRITLGYLLAEMGQLPEAITQFEVVEKADELSPGNYASLADWYLVQKQQDAHERAMLAFFKTTPEYQLSRMLQTKLYSTARGEGHLATQLDKDVLRMFAVLFEKSATPQRYLDQLQEFYEASRDFRYLAVLPDAVLGHTAERVYPFLQSMKYILDEVRDEATADELVKRINEVRPTARTDVDRRALDLLEALVERRAAELQNQPGPHREKALKAMQQAFKRAWSPGEPRLMADFLAGLGKISQKVLADEQLRQLQALHTDAAKGSLDRLHIAHQLAQTLHGYNRAADAIDLLQTALGEFDRPLPVAANEVVSSLVGYLESAGHFVGGEKFLLAQIERPVHAQQRRWLIEKLDHLYHHALQKKGEVSFGKGLDLYRALSARIQKDLGDTDDNHRYQLISLQCQVYVTAHEQKLAGVKADLLTFVKKVLPPILKQIANNHEKVVNVVARTVHDLAGPGDGIVFLLDEIDREPRWLRYSNQDGWSRQGYTLAKWREEAKDLGAVDARLLKLTLLELRRDLETRQPREHHLYYQHWIATAERALHTYYWKEKEAEFVKVAEEVLAKHSQSGDSVLYIADYFYSGLGQPKRAIEILFIAHNQKLLDDDGQARLVNYLHREGRYGESIALLQPLIERRPDNIEYRVQLMHAFFRTDRQAELLALLRQTDAFFHEKDRWGESPLNRLAQSTLDNDLFEQSVAYYKELIPLHERTHANRGIGNGTLSSYYGSLAKAYAGLKKTADAVVPVAVRSGR